ncbi:MAG: hypothetical protein RL074_1154 [Bacteroidota bacterium]|mgnify:FL=1|jgi:hypothetical protein|uniref:hypothetical protein n=1 Tax=Flavobacterium sp. TaxID=239 RepID=UPI00286F3154|nr:hypothetical protein [Flavobacterium sp.]
MKKTIALIALTSLLLVSCKKEAAVEAVAKNPNEGGINLTTSENTDMIKQMNEFASKFDTESIKKLYAPKTVIHDNLKTMTIEENMKNLIFLQSQGVTITLPKDPLVWEVVNNKPDEKTGITNYVISYYEVTFTKGDKKASVILNMNFAIKDGKIQEEWDTYDTAPLTELLK